MSTRTQRVEQLLRREIAGMLLRGDLRDPRVAPIAAISITGVRVSPDLGSARVFVDALGEGVNVTRVLQGLNAGASAMRAAIGPKIALRRTPKLRFERDESLEQGRAIEQVLAELATERKVSPIGEAAEGEAANVDAANVDTAGADEDVGEQDDDLDDDDLGDDAGEEDEDADEADSDDDDADDDDGKAAPPGRPRR